ncbi:Rid family hydrolase [Chloroflexota bacterium]
MDWEVKYYPDYWVGRKLAYPHVPKEAPKFARTMVIGNLIFVSGCTGQDTIKGTPTSDKFEDQMNMALLKVKMAMEEAGSSMDNVVKTVMLVKNLSEYPKMRRTEVEYYINNAPFLIDNPPASTFIAPASLAKPEFLIEIDVIGVLDRNVPGWETKFYPDFWGGKKLAYPHVSKEHPKFARTEVVGNMVIVSGCEALNQETLKTETMDIKEQTLICLEKVKGGMEEIGSSLDNLVKTYVLLTRIEDYPAYQEAEREFFLKYAPSLAKNPPATTIINVSSLALPEFLVEVEAFGVVDKKRKGWESRSYPEHPEKGAKASRSGTIGKLVFLSGIDGSEPDSGKMESDDIELQVAAALDKARSYLEESGSSLDNILKTFMLLKRLDHYPRMRRAEVEYYQKHAPHLVDFPPVSTFMQLSNFTNQRALFEVDITALLK